MTGPAARMRAPTQKIQTIETDIAIIGGGVAGCLAALGAAEVGAKVLICEKGGIIERSGSVACRRGSLYRYSRSRPGVGHARVSSPAHSGGY